MYFVVEIYVYIEYSVVEIYVYIEYSVVEIYVYIEYRTNLVCKLVPFVPPHI